MITCMSFTRWFSEHGHESDKVAVRKAAILALEVLSKEDIVLISK